MSKRSWINIIQLIVFLIVSALIWFRKVDGSGLAQTNDIRLITLIIWVVFCVIVAAVEVIIYYFSRKR